ncbi:hypothetical protein BJ166DRAFT_142456 [Pestalotiopsis sp. NC0098]|nr:hypothetical protein BJ166DRAFT_142456 [Pestalotiopsis sp. NC0098]
MMVSRSLVASAALFEMAWSGGNMFELLVGAVSSGIRSASPLPPPRGSFSTGWWYQWLVIVMYGYVVRSAPCLAHSRSPPTGHQLLHTPLPDYHRRIFGMAREGGKKKKKKTHGSIKEFNGERQGENHSSRIATASQP